MLALVGMVGGAAPVWAVASAAPAAAALTVYLAPSSKGGSDQHSGLSPSSPVITLARAQQVLQQQQPVGDVEIRIDQGT